MEYKLLSWNINFIHDNWLQRLNNINKILEKELEDCDIITLQEATLPFSNTIETIHGFLKKTDMDYLMTSLFKDEKLNLYKKIREYFPKKKAKMTFVMEYLMNTLMWICGYIYSIWGERLKQIYFNHPYIYLIICILCPPIFLGSWFFFGMLTLANKNAVQLKSKYIGRRIIQYIETKINERDAIVVNIHLSPGDSDILKEQRLDEIKEIYDLVKEKDISILMGDFNDAETSEVYKFLIENGYKSCMVEKNGSNINTYPCENPDKCIDFIMYKGENICVKHAELFGTKEESDHKGIKVTLEVTDRTVEN